MKITRTIVLSLTVLALGAGHPASAQAPAGVGGCSIQGIGPRGSPGIPPVLKTCGYPPLDFEVSSNLAQLALRFRVLPRIYFMNDATSPDALSSPVKLGDPNDYPPERDPFGTILLGINLLTSEFRSTPQGQRNYTVTAIMAHELGHTLQFVAQSQLPTMQREIQADFLAGWAIKSLKQTTAPDIKESAIFGTFYDRGDTAFFSPEHHGTKEERLEAFLAGFKVDTDDVRVAYSRAETYVLTTRFPGRQVPVGALPGAGPYYPGRQVPIGAMPGAGPYYPDRQVPVGALPGAGPYYPGRQVPIGAVPGAVPYDPGRWFPPGGILRARPYYPGRRFP
jgi:hypothetical protein